MVRSGHACILQIYSKILDVAPKNKEKIKNKTIQKQKLNDKGLSKFTNLLIKKISSNLDKFNYNVIIANLYETYNFLVKEIEKEIDSKDLLGNYEKILKVINPILPHLSSECLEDINNKFNLAWPKVEDKYLIEENINIIIQINGKTRSILKLKKIFLRKT